MSRTGWRLAALAAFLSGCGPSTVDVGVAVLIATPVAFIGMVVPPFLLRRLREGPRERPPGDLKPAFMGFGVACVFAVAGFARAAEGGDAELAGIAAAITGSSGMFYGQLAWLIFDRQQERFGRFALPTLLLTTAIPATLFAYHEPLGLHFTHDTGQSYALFAWAFPGYFFVPPLLLFAIAALVLWSSRRREERLRG